MNGISVLTTRLDLQDRTVRVELPRLTTKKDKKTLLKQFGEDRPKIFGALLDLLVDGLKRYPSTADEREARMGSYDRLGEAVFGQVFVTQYAAVRAEQLTESLDKSPALSALVNLTRKHRKFEGTYQELLDKLNYDRPVGDYSWPKSAKKLADLMRRENPALKEHGVIVHRLDRRKAGWPVQLTADDLKLPPIPPRSLGSEIEF